MAAQFSQRTLSKVQTLSLIQILFWQTYDCNIHNAVLSIQKWYAAVCINPVLIRVSGSSRQWQPQKQQLITVYELQSTKENEGLEKAYRKKERLNQDAQYGYIIEYHLFLSCLGISCTHNSFFSIVLVCQFLLNNLYHFTDKKTNKTCGSRHTN